MKRDKTILSACYFVVPEESHDFEGSEDEFEKIIDELLEKILHSEKFENLKHCLKGFENSLSEIEDFELCRKCSTKLENFIYKFDKKNIHTYIQIETSDHEVDVYPEQCGCCGEYLQCTVLHKNYPEELSFIETWGDLRRFNKWFEENGEL
jgi:hypothetical protein